MNSYFLNLSRDFFTVLIYYIRRYSANNKIIYSTIYTRVQNKYLRKINRFDGTSICVQLEICHCQVYVPAVYINVCVFTY